VDLAVELLLPTAELEEMLQAPVRPMQQVVKPEPEEGAEPAAPVHNSAPVHNRQEAAPIAISLVDAGPPAEAPEAEQAGQLPAPMSGPDPAPAAAAAAAQVPAPAADGAAQQNYPDEEMLVENPAGTRCAGERCWCRMQAFLGMPCSPIMCLLSAACLLVLPPCRPPTVPNTQFSEEAAYLIPAALELQLLQL
jgi:hypothetical protein